MLTREAIIEVGLAIVDEGGADRLTMRGLAQRLDVTATAIYHYFDSRDTLLEAILDHACAEIVAEAGTAGPWRRRMSRLLTAMVHHSVAHPAASVWAITTHARGEPMLQLHEAMLAVLHDAGFTPQAAVAAKGILMRFCVGHLVLHASPERHAWRHLPAEQFPNYRAAGPALDTTDHDQLFTTGLDLLLKSLQPTAH